MGSKLNTMVKGAGLVAVGMIISKILSYAFRATVARFGGPEVYGLFTLALAVLSIAGNLSQIGMSQGVTHFVAKYRSKGDHKSMRGIISSSFGISIPLSIIWAAAIFIFAEQIAVIGFSDRSLIPVLKVLAFFPPFATFSTFCIAVTVGFKEIQYRVITNQIFQNIVQIIAAFILIHPWFGFNLGAVGAAGGWLAGAVLSSLLAFYFMRKLVHPFKNSSISKHRELVEYSYPLFFSKMMNWILGWADTIMIGNFISSTQVGFYNAALPTANLVTLPFQALSSLALPSFSEIVEENEDDLEPTLKTLTHWTFAMTFPAFVLMFLFSGEMLHLLFGSQYEVASASLILLAFGFTFSTSVGPLTDLLKSIAETKIIFKNNIANIILNLALNFVLIPEWGLGLGIEGAAIATATSTIFVNSLMVAEVYYFKGILPFHRESWKPIFSALPALGIVYGSLKILFETVPIWSLVPGGIVFGIFYSVTFIFIGGLTEKDRDMLITIGRKIDREEEARKLANIIVR